MSKNDFSRTIEFDKPRKVFFDMNALEELEEELQVSSVFQVLESGVIGVKTLNRMTWAGLLHQNPELTVKEATRFNTLAIQRNGMETLVNELTRALMMGLGVPEEKIKEHFSEVKQRKAELETKKN